MSSLLVDTELDKHGDNRAEGNEESDDRDYGFRGKRHGKSVAIEGCSGFERRTQEWNEGRALPTL